MGNWGEQAHILYKEGLLVNTNIAGTQVLPER